MAPSSTFHHLLPKSPSPFCNRHWTTLGGQPRLLDLLCSLSESPAIRQLSARVPPLPLYRRLPAPPPSFARDKSQPGPPGPRLVLVVDRLIHLSD